MKQRNRHKSLVTRRLLTREAEHCLGLWILVSAVKESISLVTLRRDNNWEELFGVVWVAAGMV